MARPYLTDSNLKGHIWLEVSVCHIKMAPGLQQREKELQVVRAEAGIDDHQLCKGQ